jgi:hypothetical protein
MLDESLVGRARRVWTELAGVPVTFPAAGIAVVTSEKSLLCPPGWAGIVVLGAAGIATIPGDGLGPADGPGPGDGLGPGDDLGPEDGLGPALAELSIEAAVDPGTVRARLAPADILGPATLAYLDRRDFTPEGLPAAVEELPAGHADVVALVESVSAEDAGECGLDEVTSAVFVVREGSEVVAAAGYQHWPGSVAHLGVLTGDRYRGRGLAGLVASAAVADALDRGMLPQWRARPAASRRVAERLGFRELGTQLSLRPAT